VIDDDNDSMNDEMMMVVDVYHWVMNDGYDLWIVDV
jgi:hypothetical protein